MFRSNKLTTASSSAQRLGQDRSMDQAVEEHSAPFASQSFKRALHEADRAFEKAVKDLRVQGEHPRSAA